jgi:aldehyde:ferredoxin oxidoreductase
MELDIGEMRSIAASILDNTRRFNLREGLTLQEDGLPKRFFRETLPETRKIITEDQMKQLMNDYYRARGWNEKGEPPKSEF